MEPRKILVTGGAGFIGLNFVKYWRKKHPSDRILVIDKMGYASNESALFEENVLVDRLDLYEARDLYESMLSFYPDHIFHFAAESHVCNSIKDPHPFLKSNVAGTYNLLECARNLWKRGDGNKFIHVSTDEVFGELPLHDKSKKFTEQTPVAPRSPYSATKAASDSLVMAWHHTYGLNTIVTNCTNNYGPYQHHEKLIPRIVSLILSGQDVTIYGSGEQVRDWLHVDDHCRAIETVFTNGAPGERYCIGGENEQTNIAMIQMIAEMVEDAVGHPIMYEMQHTMDRLSDDLRYAVDCTKVKALGWAPTSNFVPLLRATVAHFVDKIRGEGERSHAAFAMDGRDVCPEGAAPSPTLEEL